MKVLKKGHRKGAYNPVGSKRAPRGGFKEGLERGRPLEMHQATCVRCKKFCEVPFKPNGKKPVFCRDCFSTQDGDRPQRTVLRTSIVPRQDDIKSQVEALTAKVDNLTRMVVALGESLNKAAK